MTAAELQRYYDYPRGAVVPQVQRLASHRLWVQDRVEFALQLPPDLPPAGPPGRRGSRETSADSLVRLDYFRPRGPGPHPLVVLSPILGGSTIFVGDFARSFAAHGFCAVVVHRERNRLRPGEGLEQVEHHLRRSVLRVRQALDWALEQPEVDSQRVASFGISYGAIINTMVAGVEPRIRYHIFALAGGDLPSIILSTTEPHIRRQVTAVARARDWSAERLREELDRTLRSDPLNSAPLLEAERVLMVVAQFDSVVGTRYENLLWRRLGKPARIVVPLGHATTALALPFIKGEALVFLQRKCGMPVRELVPPNRQAHSSKRY